APGMSAQGPRTGARRPGGRALRCQRPRQLLTQPDPAPAPLDAVIDFSGGFGRAGDPGAVSMLGTVLADLGRAASSAPALAPHAITASALLDAALPKTAFGAVIAQAAPLLRWRQNPNYTIANMGAGFMAGYGYVEFAGPKDALFHAPDIRVGLLLLG